jgi:hypothetical protein
MDYAISEVFRQLPKEIKEFLLIYNISCQWVIHWIQRFMDGKYLFYREDLKLSAAVGKFHLETHILECFWEFTWKAPASLMAKSLRHCGPLSIKSLGAQEACHVHIARRCLTTI